MQEDIDLALNLTSFLNAAPEPIFIILIQSFETLPLQVLLYNDTFHDNHYLKTAIHADEHAASLFRTWAQAVVQTPQSYAFAGLSWTTFSIADRWKVVRALATIHTSEQPDTPFQEMARQFQRANAATIQLENMMRTMDMSQVGMFEYNTHGRLLRANVGPMTIHTAKPENLI
jgi:hypothetical protein